MRFLSLVALAAVLAVPASAQATFGLKAGLNTSNFVGDDANRSEALLGFVGGLTGQFPVTPLVSVQAEALYSQKGESYFDTDDDYTLETRIGYLEVPVALRFAIPTNSALDVGVSLGGYLGVPLSAKVDADEFAPNDVVNDILDADIEAATDYGVLAGIDMGSGPFFVDARFSRGLTDVTDFDPVFGSNLDRKNQVVSLTLGYRFGGGGARY